MYTNGPSNRRVLVTGGAGYIGSQTCKALAVTGYEPITFDNLSTGHRWAVKWGPLIVGDLANSSAIDDALAKYCPDAVIHFAASASVGESMSAPREYFQNNVRGSLNLLDAMLDVGVDTIVFSSTCATYGIPDQVPIIETHPQRPVNPYGESKLFIERALDWYGKAYDLRSIALRYFNAAGADPDGELGEDHNPESHLIPLAIGAALGTRPPLKLLGTDYPTPDGTCIRDYIHVADLAEAHVAALRKLLSSDPGYATALNLGSGHGHSVLEVLRCIRNVLDKEVPYDIAPRRPGDPEVLIAQTSAHDAITCASRRRTLREAVESACRWYLSQRNVSGFRDSSSTCPNEILVPPSCTLD